VTFVLRITYRVLGALLNTLQGRKVSIIDRLFAGKVVKDFGHLELQSFGIGKRGRSVLLVEKRGELFLVVKSFAWAVFGGSVRYYTFSLSNALKLREFITDSEQIARGLVPRDDVKGSRKLFVGQIVKDFGCVEQEKFPIGRISKCALLAERGGELHLVLKFSQWALLGWNVGYQHFALEDAYKLREYIIESERIAANLPPSMYDPKREASLNALLVALATVAVALLPTGLFSIVAFAVLLMVCTHQIQIFRRFADTRIYASLLMAFLALCILIVAGIKIAPAIGL
jgi:hypothetical protein